MSPLMRRIQRSAQAWPGRAPAGVSGGRCRAFVRVHCPFVIFPRCFAAGFP